jgi:hypothetical protein
MSPFVQVKLGLALHLWYDQLFLGNLALSRASLLYTSQQHYMPVARSFNHAPNA